MKKFAFVVASVGFAWFAAPYVVAATLLVAGPAPAVQEPAPLVSQWQQVDRTHKSDRLPFATAQAEQPYFYTGPTCFVLTPCAEHFRII